MGIPIYKDVASSNINALAYQDGKGFVEFHGGRRFSYIMPQALFDQLAAAKSIGSFFAKEVRGKFAVAGTSQRCNLMSCRNDATVEGTTQAGKFWVCDTCKKDPRYSAVTFTPFVHGAKK